MSSALRASSAIVGISRCGISFRSPGPSCVGKAYPTSGPRAAMNPPSIPSSFASTAAVIRESGSASAPGRDGGGGNASPSRLGDGGGGGPAAPCGTSRSDAPIAACAAYVVARSDATTVRCCSALLTVARWLLRTNPTKLPTAVAKHTQVTIASSPIRTRRLRRTPFFVAAAFPVLS